MERSPRIVSRKQRVANKSLKSRNASTKKPIASGNNTLSSIHRRDQLQSPIRRPVLTFIDWPVAKKVNSNRVPQVPGRSTKTYGKSPRRNHFPQESKTRTPELSWSLPQVSLDTVLVSALDENLTGPKDVETNRSAVLKMLMAEWLENYEREKHQYTSYVIQGEVAIKEIKRLTENLYQPNEFMSSFCCMLFQQMTSSFGNLEPLIKTLVSELQQSIYKNCSEDDPTRFFKRTPYFTRVKMEQLSLENIQTTTNEKLKQTSSLQHELENVFNDWGDMLEAWEHEIKRAAFTALYKVSVAKKRVFQKNSYWFKHNFSGSSSVILKQALRTWHKVAARDRRARLSAQVTVLLEQADSQRKTISTLSDRLEELKRTSSILFDEHEHLVKDVSAATAEADKAEAYFFSRSHRESGLLREGELRIKVATNITKEFLNSMTRMQNSLGFLQRPYTRMASRSVFKSIDSLELNFLSFFARRGDNVEENDTANSIKALNQFLTAPNAFLIFTESSSSSKRKKDLLMPLCTQSIAFASAPECNFASHTSSEFSTVAIPKLDKKRRGNLGIINGSVRHSSELEAISSLGSPTTLFMEKSDEDNKTLFEVQVAQHFINLFYSPTDAAPFIENPWIQECRKTAQHALITARGREKQQEKTSMTSSTDDSMMMQAAAAKCIVDASTIWTNVTRTLVEAEILVEKEGEQQQQNCEDVNPSIVKQVLVSSANKVSRFQDKVLELNTLLKQNVDFQNSYVELQDQLEEVSNIGWEAVLPLSSLGNVIEEEASAKDHVVDPRLSVHDCVSQDSVTDILHNISQPTALKMEFENTINVLREHENVIRLAYATYDHKSVENNSAVMNLDQLWSFVRRLRLAKPTTILSRFTQDNNNNDIKSISASDFAEALLRIAAEQYPYIFDLAEQVKKLMLEHIVVHGAGKPNNTSIEIASSPDIQKVLKDNRKILHAIFDQYRAHLRPARRKTYWNTSSTSPPYITEREWLQFTLEYEIASIRFTLDDATAVFRNSQDDDDSTKKKNDDASTQMIYPEFCEAIVSVAMFIIPDPFIPISSKVQQLIQKKLRKIY